MRTEINFGEMRSEVRHTYPHTTPRTIDIYDYLFSHLGMLSTPNSRFYHTSFNKLMNNTLNQYTFMQHWTGWVSLRFSLFLISIHHSFHLNTHTMWPGQQDPTTCVMTRLNYIHNLYIVPNLHASSVIFHPL